MKHHIISPDPEQRAEILSTLRATKMARSSHCYVRGATAEFYDELGQNDAIKIPSGPPIWICGDCHIGNLGPVADAMGKVEIQIRDLDQTVIGNPAHDLIRLGLSLASAARGSDLPGLTTVKMIERLVESYERAFLHDIDEPIEVEMPQLISNAIKKSKSANWKTLAHDRIDDAKPTIPRGKKYWELSSTEIRAIEALCAQPNMRKLATVLKARDCDADVKLLDAAYWVKGCSSLGLLRYAVILSVETGQSKKHDYCLMDIKEAVDAVPPQKPAKMPQDNAKRVVAGALNLSPNLGERMIATNLMGKSVFVRELLPQDLKLEIDELSSNEAELAAAYLAAVIGRAHSRQMDTKTRRNWIGKLQQNRKNEINAPHWLWQSVADLLARHERNYLEHCRSVA